MLIASCRPRQRLRQSSPHPSRPHPRQKRPPAPAPTPVVAAPVKLASPRPIKVTVLADGSVHFHGTTMDMPTFQLRLADMTKTPTDQPFLVSSASDVPPGKVQAIVDGLHTANFTNVTTRVVPVAAVPATPGAAPAAAETDIPKPAHDFADPFRRASRAAGDQCAPRRER